MAAQVGIDRTADLPLLSEEMRYVARQPILDLQARVHGYELLFRNAPQGVFQSNYEPGVETILDNQVIFGLERLTNGLPAFVTCTAEALTEGWVLVLVPTMTVLCLPAALELSPKLLNACESLKTRGFRFMLDDFGWGVKPHPLLHLADYIREDFRRFRTGDGEQLLQRLQCSVTLVAQKVETVEDRLQAKAMGFTLFQGDYFCQPVLLKKRKIAANRLAHLELVRVLYREPLDTKKASDLVRRDTSLTYRLLRLVNSPIYSIYCEVRSIEAAITILGEEAFRRIVLLAVLSEMSVEQPPVILHTALVRARFCELAASERGLDAGEQYLLGMLSLLPAMLGVAMEEIVPMLPLRGPICEALAGTMNPERNLLSWLEFHEHGDWKSCDMIIAVQGLNSGRLLECYLEALIWAEQQAGA